jgi:hypothetical protein
MADDQSQRAYRSNEIPRAPMKSANDPLAELARLIGQNDPFAEFGHKAQAPAAAAQRQHAQPQHDQWAPQRYPAQRYQDQADFHAGHEQADYDQQSGYDRDPHYQDDPYRDADQGYDDEPPRKGRRGTIIAIAAVVALAIVGTAGAVGYRALFGSSGNSPPPVIKADATPTKVVPTTKSEPQSNKMIYDRVGERSSGEKIVSREEQPIDINKPSSQGAFPNVIAASQPTASTSGTSGIAAVDQPKRVHTIPIRPDQPMSTDASSQPRAAATPPSPAPRAAPPQQPQRMASAPPVTTADAENNAPVARAVPPPRQAAPSRGAPLSLSPNAPAPAPQAAPVQTASTPPPRSAAPASAAATSANGQYAVQISSQRSEEEATSAFRALQAKYPSQLGGRQPLIRRADLGSKGIYYRALVGPFANGSDAVELCQSLKTAGGSCIIQKN